MPELNGPIPNPFRAFNNMTYGVSIYLQSHEKYIEMMQSGRKDVTGLELLIQSGGATHDPLEEQTATTYNYGAKRNKFFPRDFYLDDIQFESLITGTATGGPANTFTLNFSVTEPMGLTFTTRLYNAATEQAKELGIENFNPINQIYLMVVRFYGYDKDGKQILNGEFDTSDPNSFNEKWIPFMITKFDFRLETSKVKYELQCVCPQTQIAQGQIHGTIPHGVGLQGNTLRDVLVGSGNGKGADGATNLGLVTALNRYQKSLKTQELVDIPNVYNIEFEDNVKLADAKMLPPGTKSVERNATKSQKQNTPQAASTGAASLTQGQTLSANAGMKIMKFIDLAVRSSEYMWGQYTQISDQNKDKSAKPKSGAKNKTLNWFKIRPRIDKVLGFDKKRQSWAYEITYVITVFPVPSIMTREFNNEKCFPVHKSYDIWFTGQNTEVLDFSQELNTFYFTTFTSKYLANPDENPGLQNNLSQQYVHKVNSEEAQTGEKLTDEQAANAASYLYSPADMANIDLDIVGDPDWLSQSELFYAASKSPGEPILDDGSINYDKAEVYFSVNYNTVVDYDLDTGLADVIAKNVIRNLDGSIPGSVAQYQFVYRANTIITQLEKGSFKQKLSGTLVFVPEECITGQPPEESN